MAKAICLVSLSPYFDFFADILNDTWFTFFNHDPSTQNTGSSLTFEQHVKRLVDDFPPNYPGLEMKYEVMSPYLAKYF
jgi:hypothetical protein